MKSKISYVKYFCIKKSINLLFISEGSITVDFTCFVAYVIQLFFSTGNGARLFYLEILDIHLNLKYTTMSGYINDLVVSLKCLVE